MQHEEPLSLLTYVDPVLLDLERLGRRHEELSDTRKEKGLHSVPVLFAFAGKRSLSVGVVEEGQRAGLIPDDKSDLLAVGVLGAVSSFSNSYRNGRLGTDLTVDELAAFVQRWVRNALA